MSHRAYQNILVMRSQKVSCKQKPN